LDKKLKIAIIGSRGYPYVYSGYETLVKELSERLVKKGHSVRVYCHSSLFIKKPKFVNGIELVYTPSIKSKNFSQLFNSFFSFIHVCLSEIDVVLVVNSANGPFGLITKLFRLPTAINVDGLEWLRPKWKGLGSYYFKWASKMATIFFDEIITDSIEMNKVYINKFLKNSTIIAYGPTMTKHIKKNILRKYGLDKKSYYLIVGRLIPDNNSKLILDGFIQSNSSKKIVIVGDVPYKDNYANNVKLCMSDKIILTGYITNNQDLSCLYKNCYCYIHGHEFGGTNPTMINALSINCEILALDTKFNKEMLKGKSTIFFQKNIESIVEGFEKFEFSYKKLVEENKNYNIQKKYDWEYITNIYLDVFKKLSNQKSN